jgi:hypothetical protein
VIPPDSEVDALDAPLGNHPSWLIGNAGQ